MVPIISGYNTNSKARFYLACPACKKPAEITVPAFLVAINRQTWFVCGDCQARFIVKVELLNPGQSNTGLQADGACTCAPKMPFVKVIDGQDICLECHQPRR